MVKLHISIKFCIWQALRSMSLKKEPRRDKRKGPSRPRCGSPLPAQKTGDTQKKVPAALCPGSRYGPILKFIYSLYYFV